MSTMVTEHIVTEVGESFYTIKVGGTRDPTGRENISIVVRFINELYEPTERLLTIATADQGDAATLTDTIVEELSKAGLSPRRIISQVYDGASLMAEIDSWRTYGADVRVEAAGLLRTMSEPSFRFIAEMVHSILSYLDPPNTMLQSEDMDLLTAFEKDLTKKFRSEWRDTVLRRFHSVAHRRLPLY
ncbi:hypothetical protein VZT92_015078 [Zoarces viviparus]|uniref:DUF659 domain-containing protein n=1 Tax=Zoarces viviparus TaxID=48416 RepID=A0AAW1EVP4_ZOAVI